MEPVLLSNLGEAESQSRIIKGGFQSLDGLSSVAQGDTNDAADLEAVNLYESVRECLASYLAVADRDAERIHEIGLHFADVDLGLADGM